MQPLSDMTITVGGVLAFQAGSFYSPFDGYYSDSYDADSKSRESAEITLKGIWVDMVEQGAKNPASVYGMAREVQFTTLPDLFFSIWVCFPLLPPLPYRPDFVLFLWSSLFTLSNRID